LYHSVWHPGNQPRYCLITSLESGPQLDAWIASRHPHSNSQAPVLDPVFIAEAQAQAEAKRAARAAALAELGKDPRFGDGTMALAQDDEYGQEVMSEA
jgi:hypothetical protein